jgi:hypothetical protein
MGEGRKEEEMHVLMQLQAQIVVGKENRPQEKSHNFMKTWGTTACPTKKIKKRKKVSTCCLRSQIQAGKMDAPEAMLFGRCHNPPPQSRTW